jgi:hypothetical protein
MPLKEVVGGIYSLQPLPSRWLFLLAMGTPDSPVAHRTATVHCPVHATSARPLGFGATSYILCSELWRALFTTVHFWQTTVGAWLPLLRWLTGHVRCTQDSPVNYSGARLKKPESELFGLVHRTLSGAHQTLSGAPFAAHSQALCSK